MDNTLIQTPAEGDANKLWWFERPNSRKNDAKLPMDHIDSEMVSVLSTRVLEILKLRKRNKASLFRDTANLCADTLNTIGKRKNSTETEKVDQKTKPKHKNQSKKSSRSNSQ